MNVWTRKRKPYRREHSIIGSALRMIIIILLLFFFHHARGFLIIRNCRSVHSHKKVFTGPLLLASNSFNESDPELEKEIEKGLRKRAQRCVDYPSFAYQSRGTSRLNRRDFIVRYGDSATKKNGRKRKTKKKPTVSVPKAEKESSFLERLLAPLLGGPFEMSVSQITSSAKRTRLLMERAYARSEPFATENLTLPPNLSDVSPPATSMLDGFWISTPARLLSFGAAYLLFPLITEFVDGFIDLSETQLDEIMGRFSPGISILYGTFISLTLSILYNRQRTIQENVAVECSLLTIVIRNLLSMFQYDADKAIVAGQCAADQVRTLVRSSRGAELMLLMYSDPYARMMELVDSHEQDIYERKNNNGAVSGRATASLVAYCRDILKDLTRYRAMRLSDEALALPPTHFFILNVLTFLILLSYVISIIPTLDPATRDPSNESSLLFAVLTTTYILFYNFAFDLNNPFRGVYQVRRSCAASHLLEAKWLIVNHPLTRGEVDFEEVEEEDEGILIRTPGLGEMWFERGDIYIDGEDGEEWLLD